MAESKYRFGRKKSFTTIYNSVIRDVRLSLKAKGLFAVMASLPENWEYTVGGLASVAGVGKDTIRTTLNELQEVGYLIREQSHDAGGKFARNVYILQDEAPVPLSGNPDNGEAPLSGKPSTVETRQRLDPMTDNPTLQSKEESNNIPPYNPPTGGTRKRRKKEPREAPDWNPERFEGLWKYYPKAGRKDKQSAMDAWDALQPDDTLIDTMAIALKKLKSSDEWKREIGIPYVAKFLRTRRWEDAESLDAEDEPAESGEPEKEEFGWR